MFLKKLMTLTCATLMLASAPVFAKMGTESGGGGSDIEAGFKVKLLNISTDLNKLPTEVKSKLKFNASELYTVLRMPGRFKPLCAKEEKLVQMQTEGKMARVFSDQLNIVNLDCKNFTLEEWRNIFQSSSPEDVVFFIHEALRIVNLEGEDDYNISSSYVDVQNEIKEADEKKNDKVKRVASAILNGMDKKCKVYYAATAGHGYVEGSYTRKVVRTNEYGDPVVMNETSFGLTVIDNAFVGHVPEFYVGKTKAAVWTGSLINKEK